MSTRSLTFVKDDEGSVLVCLYRQSDGYPTGHGQELKEFLAPFHLVNGIGSRNPQGPIANGMGCLAAQLVAQFKTDVGGIYLYPTDTKDAGQDFVYVIARTKGTDTLSVTIASSYAGTLYDGPIAEADMEAIETKMRDDEEAQLDRRRLT